MAPEILARKKYNKTADYWSFGAIVYEMYMERPPYYGYNGKTNEIEYADFLTKTEASFIKGLLENNPKKRLGYKNID